MSTTQVSPHTLKDILALPDQKDYEIKCGYWLELSHGLMGTFPAVFKNTNDVVITFNIDLLAAIWALLPPQRSKINTDLWYHNAQTKTAFLLSRWENSNSMLTAQKLPILTKDKFLQLTSVDPEPFEWQPGLANPYLAPRIFQDHIKREIERLQQTRS